MKTTHALIFASALLALPLSSCAAAPSTPATPLSESWPPPNFTFEPMAAEKQEKLRHAIENCARVDMAIQWFGPRRFKKCSDKRWRFVKRTESYDAHMWAHEEWVRTLKRGAELDAILPRLSVVQQWYTPVFDKRLRYQPGALLSIRFLDAEGKELYAEWNSFGPWSSCKGEQGQRVSLLDFFPDYPERSSFSK